MTTTAAIRVNDILNRVAVECGLEAVQDPYGSPTQHFKQMKYLLQSAGEQLCLAYPWEFLVRKFEVTTVAGTNSYDLPPDFQSFIDQSGWNNTTEEPLIGPLSSQEWNAVLGRSNENLMRYAFRIFGSTFQIFPNPPADGMDLTMEYQSRYFSSTAGVPVVYLPSFTSGTDIILFDRTLITRMLKVMWLDAKGFDISAAQAGLNQVFGTLTGKDKGGRVLDAGGNYGGIRYITGANLPISGFGL